MKSRIDRSPRHPRRDISGACRTVGHNSADRSTRFFKRLLYLYVYNMYCCRYCDLQFVSSAGCQLHERQHQRDALRAMEAGLSPSQYGPISIAVPGGSPAPTPPEAGPPGTPVRDESGAATPVRDEPSRAHPGDYLAQAVRAWAACARPSSGTGTASSQGTSSREASTAPSLVEVSPPSADAYERMVSATVQALSQSHPPQLHPVPSPPSAASSPLPGLPALPPQARPDLGTSPPRPTLRAELLAQAERLIRTLEARLPRLVSEQLHQTIASLVLPPLMALQVRLETAQTLVASESHTSRRYLRDTISAAERDLLTAIKKLRRQ